MLAKLDNMFIVFISLAKIKKNKDQEAIKL